MPQCRDFCQSMKYRGGGAPPPQLRPCRFRTLVMKNISKFYGDSLKFSSAIINFQSSVWTLFPSRIWVGMLVLKSGPDRQDQCSQIPNKSHTPESKTLPHENFGQVYFREDRKLISIYRKHQASLRYHFSVRPRPVCKLVCIFDTEITI